MATVFQWATTLLGADGKPAVGATLAVEIFDLAAKDWVQISTGRTAAGGALKGRGTIADDTLPFAPALRLVEGQAVMSTTPSIMVAARGRLVIDFGEVKRNLVATPFVLGGGRGTVPFVVGGGSTAAGAVDIDRIRDEVGRDFRERLTIKDRALAERETRIADLDRNLGVRLADLVKKDSEISRLQGVIAEREQALAAAQRARGSASTTRVTDLASTIGGQLDDAQTALKSRGFSLGAIEVNARALLKDEGRRLEFPDPETLKALPAGSLADVKMNFQPDAPPPAVPEQTVPDLMFLTENRARAVLASLGLTLEASRGPAALNRDAAPGQGMLQTPGPGVPVPRGGRVHMIFAAEEE